MRVLLVLGPAWDVTFPSLGLPYVAAALRDAGHEVRLRDLNIEAFQRCKDPLGAVWHSFEYWQSPLYERHVAPYVEPILDEVVAAARGFAAEAVGFAFTGTNTAPTEHMLAALRRDCPQMRRFGGGPGLDLRRATAAVEATLLHGAVVGEGEQSVVALLRSWCEPGDGAPIPGVVAPDGNGGAAFGGFRALAPLNTLPVPDFRDVDVSLYNYPEFYDLPGSLPVLASRGCTFRCTFCSEHESWQKYRYRDAEQVVAELMSHEREHGAQRFLFMDSLLNGNHRELVRLVELLEREDRGYTWGGQARLDGRLTESVLAGMARAGCRWLLFGFESGSQSVLDDMKKHVRVEDAREVIRSAHRHGIHVHLHLIVGYPGEGRAEFRDTLRQLADLRECISGVSAYRLRMHRGSPLYQRAEEYDLVLEEDIGDLEAESWRLSDRWRLRDGSNTQEVRMRRYRTLIRFLARLGIPTMSEPLVMDGPS